MIGVGTTIFLVNPQTFGGGSSFANDYSLLFDGVDEYVNVPALTDFSGLQNYSISFWFKLNDTDLNRLFGYYSSGVNYLIINHDVSGEVRFQGGDGTGTYKPTTGVTFTTGVWYHCVCVFDGTQGTSSNRKKIYIDGVDRSGTSAGTHGTAHPTTITDFKIGGNFAVSNMLNGYMDEVSVFHYSLTGTQVTSIYNSGTPTDLDNTSGVTAPVHWWRMGDGDTYPTINDVGTTGGNNGTMTNQEVGDIVSDVPS